jgi:hypothetical protein
LVDVGTVVDVAIKQMVEEVGPAQMESLWKEARIMCKLRNEYVVRFYGIVNDSKVFKIYFSIKIIF